MTSWPAKLQGRRGRSLRIAGTIRCGAPASIGFAYARIFIASAQTQAAILTPQAVIALLQPRCFVQQPAQVARRQRQFGGVILKQAAKVLAAGVVLLGH